MPYKLIGPAHNASREAVVSLEVEGANARIGVYVSRPRRIQVTLLCDGAALFQKEVALSPETALVDRVSLPTGTRPQALTLRASDGTDELVSYTPLPDEQPDSPAPATPAPPPHEIASSEELFLNGLHLEQYRHAAYGPEPYYNEALRRDPHDSRCNNALGLLLYRRGEFAAAEPYFRTAIRRLTSRNPNPYDGEPFYNLGLSLRMQGRYREAFDAFYKAVWNAAWQDAAYFELARLASRDGRPDEALELVDRSLMRNDRHHKARHLKIALLRRLGRTGAALAEADASLALDRMEYGALRERHLLAGDPDFERLVRPDAGTYVELALDYAHAGLFDDALALLDSAPRRDPLLKYTQGWIYLQAGERDAARRAVEQAATLPPDYCFPNRLEDVLALEAAISLNPGDARAPYYLGNFWYAHRRYDAAVACWEQARTLDAGFPTVHRNLGLAYYNKLNEPPRALESFETAFALNPADARVLFELDQLYKRLNRAPEERLAFLQRHAEQVDQRDDLTIERITLLTLLGRPDDAFGLLSGRSFHPWEGGEGKVTGQYVASLVEIARRLLRQGEHAEAVARLEQAQVYPHNLGEGKLYGAQENNILYELGRAYEGLGQNDRARDYFTRAASGLSEPTSAMYYNDQPPDMIFYQGLARRKLGQQAEAQAIFRKLVEYGQAHLNDKVTLDYFAVSLPAFLVFDEDLNRRNRIHCLYMMALGYAGLGDQARADAQYADVLELDAGHLGATVHRRLLHEQ